MNLRARFVLASILFLTFTAPASAQETIAPDDGAKFIDQQKTVCGKVASARYAVRSKGRPTFLNLDKPYPHQVFTVLIRESDRSKLEKPPEALSERRSV